MERHELKFGTSGLRDKVGFMTDMECYINTRGFLKFLKERGEVSTGGTVAIGGDRRGSTPRIMAAVDQAVRDEGLETFHCGLVPSPTLANFGVRGSMPSIMVTGSHIPDDRNGIKFSKKGGEVLKTDEADILKNVAVAREEIYGQSADVSSFDDKGMFKEARPFPEQEHHEKAVKEYKRRYTNVFSPDTFKDKKIVIYQHSAVGRDIIKDIFEALGAEVVTIGRSEAFVPVDTEKVSEDTLELLKKAAEEHKPFAIISTDGDSDRPLLADENGHFLPGDKLGALVSIFLKPDFVAVPISANDAVVKALTAKGIEVVQTQIGSPHVIAAMNQRLSENASSKVVSWESNGGFLLGSDWEIEGKKIKSLPTRDAVLPLVCSILLAEKEGKTVSELISTSLPSRYTHADVADDKMSGCETYTAEMGKKIIKMFSPADPDIIQMDFNGDGVIVTDKNGIESKCQDEDAALYNTIKEQIEKYFNKEKGFEEIASINVVDGIRIVFSNDEVAHIRPSGNAPEFRMYATADTQERADEIVETRKVIVPEIIADLSAGPKSVGAQAAGEKLESAIGAVRAGEPVCINPYKEPKVWGVDGVGEYWYGAEFGDKTSEALIGGVSAPMCDLVDKVPNELLGKCVVEKFGIFMPLVKILTPKGRLSVQFHDAKNELWIITGVDNDLAQGEAQIVLGFSREAVDEYKDQVAEKYREALIEYGKTLNALVRCLEQEEEGQKALDEMKNAEEAANAVAGTIAGVQEFLDAYKEAEERINYFYNYMPVKIGDVIPVPSGTLHALAAGVEVVEPQIAGPTQSLEDGATYPIRYAFPEFPVEGAKKMLDIDRVEEMHADVVKEQDPIVIKEDDTCKVERLPGDFEDKGLEVHRITLNDGAVLPQKDIKSFHTLVTVAGKAQVVIGGREYDVPKAIPGGEMLLIPASAGNYTLKAGGKTQIIDTFTPC